MEYRIGTNASWRLAERLRKCLPGGDTRSPTFYPPFPLAISRGDGHKIWDVDGNEFIDFLNNYTSLVHGNAHPAIVSALTSQAPLGTAFAAPHEGQAELAERICGRFSSIERVRFTNSGTEAVMLAVRVARAFTGRERLVKADGGYHGSWEQVPMSWTHQHGVASSDSHLSGETWDRGIPKDQGALVHLVDYNNSDELEAVMRKHGPEVAAILFEPVLGEGVIAGSPAFFQRARDLADEYGALLILDEVVTARLAIGGYQAVLNVEPDLTTLGKIIGGGLPVGALGGRADVMEISSPLRDSFLAHAGTFNGNPLTMAAGCASLDHLTPGEVDRINALGQILAAELRRTIAAVGVRGLVTSCGSLVHLHFDCSQEINSFRDVNLDSLLLSRLHLAALEEGVYFAPRGMLNVSTAMDETVIREAVDRFARALERVHEETPQEAALPA